MKLIHLSDLHLGKRVNEFSMIEDQKYILNEILRIIDKEAPDGVLLAGDLYDRPVPSAEAVQLFDRFLTQLAERKIPVYAISGNHDSAERIAFGSQIMSSSGICMTPVYDGKTEKYCLTDSYGEVWIHLLPFVRPATVRHGLEGEEEVKKNSCCDSRFCQLHLSDILLCQINAPVISRLFRRYQHKHSCLFLATFQMTTFINKTSQVQLCHKIDQT